MAAPIVSWLAIRTELPRRRSAVLAVFSLVLPLLIWTAVSYVPFIWHPMVPVPAAGSSGLSDGKRYDREVVAEANAAATSRGESAAIGPRANPVFLPAPHEVARGFYRAF